MRKRIIKTARIIAATTRRLAMHRAPPMAHLGRIADAAAISAATLALSAAGIVRTGLARISATARVMVGRIIRAPTAATHRRTIAATVTARAVEAAAR
jgi:hypothetical protein